MGSTPTAHIYLAPLGLFGKRKETPRSKFKPPIKAGLTVCAGAAQDGPPVGVRITPRTRREGDSRCPGPGARGRAALLSPTRVPKRLGRERTRQSWQCRGGRLHAAGPGDPGTGNTGRGPGTGPTTGRASLLTRPPLPLRAPNPLRPHMRVAARDVAAGGGARGRLPTEPRASRVSTGAAHRARPQSRRAGSRRPGPRRGRGPVAGARAHRGGGTCSPGQLTHLRHGRMCAGGGGRSGIPGCEVARSLAAAPWKAGG